MPRAWAAASASATGIAMQSSFVRRKPFRDERVEAQSTNEFHHHEVRVPRRLELVDGDDVRMIQRGQDPRLLKEAAAAVLVGEPLGRQDLDCHFATQTCVDCPIHLAHAAGAERRQDFIAAEPGARAQMHGHKWPFVDVGQYPRDPAGRQVRVDLPPQVRGCLGRASVLGEHRGRRHSTAGQSVERASRSLAAGPAASRMTA